jgi:DNA repair exonuclease SbcCD nuclease subunit
MTTHVILGDVHFGVKNGCQIMLQHQLDFLYSHLIPFCQANHIQSILQTGDLFDVRKTTNNLILPAVKQFMEDLVDQEIDFNGIVGNHDLPYKNSSKFNTPSIHLSEFYSPIESFKTIGNIDFVGWIHDGNRDEILRKVAASTSRFCFGHFEFVGFEMSKGYICEHGLDANLFSRYELVISGHYHGFSRKDNVLYVGTPLQHNWGDYKEKRGFWVFDDECGIISFIENEIELFVKILYDEDTMYQDVPSLENKWVRVTVKNKTDQKKFDVFIDRVNKAKPAELKVIEDLVKHNESYTTESVDITNAPTIMKQYVEQTVFPNLDSTVIFDRLNEIYKEALLQ